MKDLADAIVARFAVSASAPNALRAKLTEYTGSDKLYLHPAPRGVFFPHITYSFADSRAAGVMGSSPVFHDVHTVTFSIWDTENDLERSITLRDLLVSVYDDVSLSLSGGRNVVYALRKNGGNPVREPDGKGWGTHIDYDYYVG